MTLTDKLLSRIGASKQGEDELYRQRRNACIAVSSELRPLKTGATHYTRQYKGHYGESGVPCARDFVVPVLVTCL